MGRRFIRWALVVSSSAIVFQAAGCFGAPVATSLADVLQTLLLGALAGGVFYLAQNV